MMTRWTCIPAFAVMAGLGGASASASSLFSTDWAVSAKSRARLIADGVGAGFEIELASGAITYWRDPGDAGVPPTFDFGGSENLSRAEVEFPPPRRIRESDGSLANGYEDRALFPIRVTAKDPSQPVALKVTVNYAVCEKICLPAKASLGLELRSGVSGPFDQALSEARGLTPKTVPFAELGGAVEATAADRWRLCFNAIQGAHELFLESPRGAWLETTPEETTAGRECHAVTLHDLPAGAAPVVTATLSAAAGSKQTTFALPPR